MRDPGGRVLREWCEFAARSVCSGHGDSGLGVGCFFVDIYLCLGWAWIWGGGSGRDWKGWGM